MVNQYSEKYRCWKDDWNFTYGFQEVEDDEDEMRDRKKRTFNTSGYGAEK